MLQPVAHGSTSLAQNRPRPALDATGIWVQVWDTVGGTGEATQRAVELPERGLASGFGPRPCHGRPSPVNTLPSPARTQMLRVRRVWASGPEEPASQLAFLRQPRWKGPTSRTVPFTSASAPPPGPVRIWWCLAVAGGETHPPTPGRSRWGEGLPAVGCAPRWAARAHCTCDPHPRPGGRLRGWSPPLGGVLTACSSTLHGQTGLRLWTPVRPLPTLETWKWAHTGDWPRKHTRGQGSSCMTALSTPKSGIVGQAPVSWRSPHSVPARALTVSPDTNVSPLSPRRLREALALNPGPRYPAMGGICRVEHGPHTHCHDLTRCSEAFWPPDDPVGSCLWLGWGLPSAVGALALKGRRGCFRAPGACNGRRLSPAEGRWGDMM